MTDNDMIALLGSRICHDLVNPLGAIGNGVELLAMTTGDSEELTLIRDAVQNATARLNYFRVAFGAAAEGQTMSARALRDILQGMSAGGRHQLHWQIDADVTRRDARAAFLVLLAMETALPFGGEITVTPDWRLHGTGRRVAIDAALWDPVLSGKVPEALEGGQVHFGMLPRALREAGRSAQMSSGEDSITVQI